MTQEEMEQMQQMQGMSGAEGPGVMFFVVYFAFLALIIASMWKVFTKAGKPGWAAIVPIYNIVVMLEIVGRPLWWIALLLFPCTAPIAGIILCIDMAKSFGKSTGYGIGLALLGFIFFPMLAFSDAAYVGPAAAKKA